MKFLKKYFLVLLLSFIAVGMIVFKINYKSDYSQNVSNINTSTIENKENNYPLENKLPYYGKNFTILEYIEPLVIKIKVVSDNKEDISDEMILFFKENNLEINSHKFVFED